MCGQIQDQDIRGESLRIIHAMRQRRDSSLNDNRDAEFPVLELSLLAREARRRQHLTRSTQPQRLRPLSPREVIPATAALPAVLLTEDLCEAQPAQSKPSSPQNHVPLQQPLRHPSSAAKERKKASHGGRDTRRRKCRSNNARKDYSGNHHRLLPPMDQQQQLDDDRALYPGVEAAMLRVFGGGGRNRGVSVSAIRRLYRRRHEEEKARAIEEVRRWWRIGRSEAVPLAQATIAASLMLASRDGDVQNCPDGTQAAGLADKGTAVLQDPTRPNDALAMDGFHLGEEHRGRDQARCHVLDGLDCSQVMQDPSHVASVVRDVKQALRAGQSVKIRFRQESPPSLGTRNSADSQLMLRTIYMQCVRVSIGEVDAGSFSAP